MSFDEPLRVESKHLFNYKLDGVSEDAIMANDDEFYETNDGQRLFEMWLKMEELKGKDDSHAEAEYVDLYRKSENIEWRQLGKHHVFDQANKDCAETTVEVPTSHCGAYDVAMHVYTPKKLTDQTQLPGLIYAHGGGVVASSADIYKPWLVQIAAHCDIVVFNVDYRLAPETKYPNNAKDFYECVRYVSKNAASLNIDPKRIAISGMSGGGYICLATMVLLAKNDESELVKLAIPETPMCS